VSGTTLRVARRPPERRPRGRPTFARADRLGASVAILAAVVFAVSAAGADPRGMTDLGLIAVMPLPSLLALLAVNVSFCATLRRPDASTLALAIHVLTLLFMLYGVTAIIEDVPRIQATYRHLGIIEELRRTGQIDPTIDAYFDWPGFFAFGALLFSAAGIDAGFGLAKWASLADEVLYLGPLLLILRALTPDRRHVWLALWLVAITNWVGQDYFAPQSFAYFLYLAMLAVLLRWFTRAEPLAPLRLRRAARPDGAGPAIVPPGVRGRVAMLAIVIALFAAMVPSHQLTPYAGVLAVAAIVVVGLCPLRTLPVLMGVMVAAWVVYMATPYLEGHIKELVGGVGSINENVDASVGSRLAGSTEHLVVVRLRLIATLVLWGLAAFGVLIRWRRGALQPASVLLIAAPFVLLALQPYGGEMLLRVYFLSLPFVAFHAAEPLRADAWRPGAWRRPAVGLAIVTLFSATFFVTRYGNERSDFITAESIAAVEQLYELAPPGAVLYGDPNTPWQFAEYGQHQLRYLTELDGFDEVGTNPDAVRTVLRSLDADMRGDADGHGAYLITTRAGETWLDLLQRPAGRLHEVHEAIASSPRFERIFANRDAAIYKLADR
jgi:hypothetical protein